MTKLVMMVPVFASARFTVVKPKNWDVLSDEEKVDFFVQNSVTEASLCHQCSQNFESDMEIDTDWFGYSILQDLKEINDDEGLY